MPVFGKAYFGSILLADAPVGAPLIKTGQTTSYATGDDGGIQAGRSVDFFTLAKNNPFGNANRFTALDGSQTYTNNIVIDWSTYDGTTVLGYYRGSIVTNRTWADAITWGTGLNVAGYTGWRLTNIRELYNLCFFEASASGVLGYAPFSLANNIGVWTSTTTPNDTLQAFRLLTVSGAVTVFTKTSSIRTIACRNFTVTGTTLT